LNITTKFIIGIAALGLVAAGCQQAASAKEQGGHAQVLAHKNAEGQLVCPVMGGIIPSADKAAGHSDHEGTRYYFCCPGCKPQFDKEPSKYAKAHEDHQHDQGAETEIAPVTVGKYVVELWPPEGGVFAGEELDIEVGVFDSGRKDADGGLAGVESMQVSAVVTMPSMEGMPEQRPHVHKEGRAGVHGLEVFFPHGGEYQIDVTFTPAGDQPKKATFKLNVRDERPTDTAKAQPYELQVVNLPQNVRAGQPFDLKMRVVDTKTGKPVTAFETVHEEKFHLLLAPQNLSHLIHEHPQMAPDGTWTYRATLPAGGDWWVYGDVAPVGKGSRILVGQIKVQGAPPSGQGMAVAGRGPAKDRSITGRIEPLDDPIPLGKSTTLRVRLTDSNTGQPVADTQKWLGAAGHLMIIHEDGQTIVHSHPKEDAQSAALVKKGEVQFTGRFPKTGKYIAYSQFKRGGEIHTLGYTLEVR
jgi:YHS domain-containing protein